MALVRTQILIQEVWVGIPDSSFLISSGMLTSGCMVYTGEGGDVDDANAGRRPL